MLEKFIAFFATRHLMMNFFAVAIVIGGCVAWNSTNKEELPEMVSDFIRIRASYPGASAADVEYDVTKPIEEQLRGLDGVYRISSNSSAGQSNINVELEKGYPKVTEALNEIKNAVQNARLPSEIIDEPTVRVFQTSKKAILDIALIDKENRLLDAQARQRLQSYALALENQLLNLPEVNSINRRGYLQEELQVKVDPERLKKYKIPLNDVLQQIESNHVRRPAGNLEDEDESKVTLLSELNTPEKLNQLIIQGGFDGEVIRLQEIASTQFGFEKTTSIRKVDGHESVMFNVVKNSQYGILDALDAVMKAVERFEKNSLSESSIDLVLLDDESIDVRNRLDIITMNSMIGFALILMSLLIFLNFEASIWVALGIPISFCFTMIGASFLGFTINGTTLAAVIIVMGMIVDDAIVVAENIIRLKQSGMERQQAVIQGTTYVLLPITASIVTTCIAFVPLFFFTGWHSRMIVFIPPIVFLMLFASLLESILILPCHLNSRRSQKKKTNSQKTTTGFSHWFSKIEKSYAFVLSKILKVKLLALIGLGGFLWSGAHVWMKHMKFEMFPNEETRDISLSGKAPDGYSRVQTARLVEKIEDVVIPYIGKEVVGFRTDIAQSRRGGRVEENRFRMVIEIVTKEKRKLSADELLEAFKTEILKIEGFKDLRFAKSRWGAMSGSPIELVIHQNNDQARGEVARLLKTYMQDNKDLKNVEIDEPLKKTEYRISIKRDELKKLSISPGDVISTFRAALEGMILYEFAHGEEDVRLRVSINDDAKKNIEEILEMPVENRSDYLVSLKNVIDLEKVQSPTSISRSELKRYTTIDADIQDAKKTTPLDIASWLENEVFPKVQSKYPTVGLSFDGEIKHTRESKNDLQNAVYLAVFLIYVVLAVLFNSLWYPFLIIATIPFGVAGVLWSFHLHGKELFGFFAAVGTLGLSGVVINDAIIMVVKLRDEFKQKKEKLNVNVLTAEIASTRLRAIVLTTLTTVAGVLPTAYGFAGYDAMLAEMMLALAWGLICGTMVILILVPCLFALFKELQMKWSRQSEVIE